MHQVAAAAVASASFTAARKLQHRSSRKNITHHRSRCVVARSQDEYKELVSSLKLLADQELAAWAAQNRERLSLRFLGWLSEEELAAASTDPDNQQQLWDLGSKLMVLREGLSPVGNDVLQAELRNAALKCSTSFNSSSGEDEDEQELASSPGDVHGSTAQRRQDAQQQQQQDQQQQGLAVLANPALGSVVQQAAALGLSPEGMTLFQQQAAALEAMVGVSRARSLTEVIGRTKVQGQQQLDRMAEADAAVRILDVLLSVPHRDDRAAMLPDAFDPPASSLGEADDAVGYSSDEDQVSTSPLRLLQAIDLYLARLQDGGAGEGRALLSAHSNVSAPQMRAALLHLREDVDAYWQALDEDGC
ncbi:hypothetical protein D9Q98_000281 [Chlorella vulgaris]|uniref:Uncharacterized protein n=1 Tax=Chlorella vulgaris TaxID=3077 RepID=A0A9D4TY46_CHLVU|nr:hypothetical protein D9Q98_000281 [Chlorella vulgaris]